MSEQQERWTRELISMRKGEGLTVSKLVRSRATILDELPSLDQNASREERATHFIELVHRRLHVDQGDREMRALAHALNLDASNEWTGQPTRITDTELLMARRRSFASAENISEDGGKPMSDWEQTAATTLIDSLAELPASPLPSAEPPKEAVQPGVDSATPAERQGAQQTSSHIRSNEKSKPSPHSMSSNRPRVGLIAAAAAFALLIAGVGYWAGSQGDGDGASPDQGIETVVEPAGEPAAAADPTPTEQPTTVPTATAAPDPTATPEPEPTATTAPTSTPEPTPTPEPTATPAPPTPTPLPTVPPIVSLASIEPSAGSWNTDRGFGDTGFGLSNDGNGSLVLTAFHGSCSIGWHTRDTEYNLAQQFSTFRTNLVMDQRSGSESIYTVSFFIDDADLPVRQYDINLFTDEIENIEIDVRGARRLRIESDAKFCKFGDHAIFFIGAELIP